MAAPFRIKGLPNGKRVQCFEMIEFEVEFDKKDDFFHLSNIGERNYHNAYDADENFTLFRADAVFIHNAQDYIVPVFAAQKQPKGQWQWYVRFRPHQNGAWRLRIRVLSWHRKKIEGDPSKPLKGRYPPGQQYQPFYEYKFGFKEEDYRKYRKYSERVFTVNDTKRLSGPLEIPGKNDNPNYFYRWTDDGKSYKRRLFFLLGAARPWVSERKKNKDPWSLYSYLERGKELFEVMRNLGQKKTSSIQSAGCNVLLHWMAPWESLLVHQSPFQYQYLQTQRKFAPFPKPKNLKAADDRLGSGDMELGYKRYDQGRSLHTDKIFDLAAQYEIMLFWVVMPHNLLRDCDHDWGGFRFGKANEQAYKNCHPKFKNGKKKTCGNKLVEIRKPESVKHPSQINGFQCFKKKSGDTISIEEFFLMNPKADVPWQRQLWKHYANFWRYLIGRWASHPALGAWVLIDEMDGVGAGKKEKKNDTTSWWWQNKDKTYVWHDNLIKLLCGKLPWEPPEGWKWEPPEWLEDEQSCFTGDYLQHPTTSSATDYEATDWYIRRKKLAAIRGVKNETHVDVNTVTEDEAIKMLNEFSEIHDHGDWRGNKQKIDFVSHHVYHLIPTWGRWNSTYKKTPRSFTGWHKSDKGIRIDEKTCQEVGAVNINIDLWLWDSLCMRMHNWNVANIKFWNKLRLQYCPRLITEYGCWERAKPSDNHNKYGNRYPSYAHFANWAALMLGHAGIPFEWNDGKEFGEMIGRRNNLKKNPFDPDVYPVNNYAEIENILSFLEGVNLEELQPSETGKVADRFLHVVSQQGGKFNVWALANFTRTRIVAWIYDRKFSRKNWQLSLNVEVCAKNKNYNYSWFDTWNGHYLPGGQGVATSDSAGYLRIRFSGSFPRSRKNKGVADGDGNDIAIRITSQRKI